MRVEVKHLKIELSNICSKHIATQKEKDILEVKVRGLELGQCEEITTLKANYQRDL